MEEPPPEDLRTLVTGTDPADLEDAAAIAENLANPDDGQDFDEFVADLRAGRASPAVSAQRAAPDGPAPTGD